MTYWQEEKILFIRVLTNEFPNLQGWEVDDLYTEVHGHNPLTQTIVLTKYLLMYMHRDIQRDVEDHYRNVMVDLVTDLREKMIEELATELCSRHPEIAVSTAVEQKLRNATSASIDQFIEQVEKHPRLYPNPNDQLYPKTDDQQE